MSKRDKGLKNLKRRGRIWYFRAQKNGVPYEQSLETDDVRRAKERRDEILRSLAESGWVKHRATFNEVVEAFAEIHFPRIKPTSARRYAVSILSLADIFDGVLWDEITPAKLNAFVDHRWADEVTGSTIRRDLACLSAMWTFAKGRELTTRDNPVHDFLFANKTTLRENPARDVFLTVDEEPLVIAAAPPKVGFAIKFAIDTGLRKKEMLRLRTSDIDLKNRRLFVRSEDSKSGKGRWVPLLPRILEELKRADMSAPYLFMTEEGKPYSAVSPYFYEALKRAVKRAGLTKHVEWHDLRRTCGCRLLQELGLSMEYVSAWLGHSSVAVTQRHYAFLQIDQLQREADRSTEAASRLANLGQKLGHGECGLSPISNDFNGFAGS